MAENQENTQKPKTETTKIEGISAQINLSPGSDTHRRFVKHFKESGAVNARAFVDYLLDCYETPHTDNSEVISNLEQQVVELRKKDTANEQAISERDTTINELKEKLEAARNEANENAVMAQQIQLQNQTKDGEIRFIPNPVVAHFLNEMATKTGKTTSYILEKLYMDDLQNPRANNLPYTVTAAQIREVMAQLKKQEE